MRRAFPSVPDLRDRGLADGVGRLYTTAFERGELILTEGHSTNIAQLLREALQRFGAPSSIVCDRWREGELRDSLKAAKVPPCPLTVRGMGFRDGAEDVRGFRRAVLEGGVVPVPSLLLSNCIGEARTVADPAGKAKLAKGAEGRRRLCARDDAAILAIAEGRRQGPGPKQRRWRYRRAWSGSTRRTSTLDDGKGCVGRSLSATGIVAAAAEGRGGWNSTTFSRSTKAANCGPHRTCKLSAEPPVTSTNPFESAVGTTPARETNGGR